MVGPLMYGTMLALTKQNMAHKVAPLSTATMQGIVINRNITVGETVCCYYNDSGELTRLGDIPPHNGNFFVDENNRLYYFQDGKVHVIDGLSGHVQEEIDAYEFSVPNGGECCAYRITDSREEDIWIVALPDGSRVTIDIPVGSQSGHTFGYRNGVIGIACNNGFYSGITLYTYCNGQLHELTGQGNLTAADHVYPINETTVAVDIRGLSYFWNVLYRRYAVSSDLGMLVYEDPWNAGGYVTVAEDTQTIGADQSYVYQIAGIYEEVEIDEQGTTEKVFQYYAFGRWSIDDYSGVEILETFTDPRTYYGPNTPWGNMIYQETVNEETVRQMIDISTRQPVYVNELPDPPATSLVRENEAYIWIEGMGVYKKTPLGWLMYPTSSYPRSSPWGKLGYSIRNTKIGRNGLAIVLFE